MHRYIGSGPYCYSNSLAMLLGDAAPSPSVIEVLTGSPFGFALLGGKLPLFDPYGWDPDIGLDNAIELLGWECVRQGADDSGEALRALREAVKDASVLVGPVEIGLLLHQPGMTQPIESDHFVVVLEVTDEWVTFHDPQGFPYSTLPVEAFLAAWRADSIGYKTTSYTMRSAFRRVRMVDEREALRASIPLASAWLRGRDDLPAPPGTLGGFEGLERLATMVGDGLSPSITGHLTYFAIRVGARRLVDAATILAGLGNTRAASIADRQARLVGSLQFDFVAGSPRHAATTLRELAPTYEELANAL